MFRKCIITDLQLSDHLKATGLEKILFDIVKDSFSGKPFMPPEGAQTLMDELLSPAHSLCKLTIRGSKTTYV